MSDATLGSRRDLLEVLTVVVLLPAVVLGAMIFLRRRELPRGVGWLMLLAGLAALYFAGEEASWGQHWLGYGTPQAVARINEQGEFNIHNISSLFNNVPRQLMFGGALVGGMVLPLALRRRLSWPEAPKSLWYWLIPNYRLVLISAMAVFLRLPNRLHHWLGAPPTESYLARAVFRYSGEFKEYCFALIILLYLLSVYLRMGLRKSSMSEREPKASAGEALGQLRPGTAGRRTRCSAGGTPTIGPAFPGHMASAAASRKRGSAAAGGSGTSGPTSAK